jgi:endonuclease YncB( thermonuclease family)
LSIYSGIDAPEMNQEYGKEAKTALRELIQEKPLKILVYGIDPYDRFVGDVYCNNIFVQV